MARIEGPFCSALRWCCGSWKCRCRLKCYTVNTRIYTCQQQTRFISELSDAFVLFCPTLLQSAMNYLIRDDPARDEDESVRVVALSKYVRVKSTITTMECSFALTGKDYVIIAADTTAARSIVKMKIDEDKIKTLSPHLLMAYSGESGSFTFTHPRTPKKY